MRGEHLLTFSSFRTGKPSRVRSDRHIVIAVLGNTRKGRVRVGIRARAGDRKLLRRRPN
jgi:hypothetical protein